MKRILLALGLVFAMPLSSFADSMSDAMNALALISSRACCKVCTAQACGDSCISTSYTCHKDPGCACQGGGSSGGSNSGGSRPPGSGGSNNKPPSGNNSKPSKPAPKPQPALPECPAAIARIDAMTFSVRKNFRCFPKATNADNKGFVREPEDGSLNSKALVNLRIARVKCPKIIVDKRSGMYTGNAEYLCYESKAKASKAGFRFEG